MASPSSPKSPSPILRERLPEATPRITVYELFKRHIQSLAGIPGEASQFDQSEHGYEWRCEYELGVCSPDHAGKAVEKVLQLHFSLIDLERQPIPAAVLYLVELSRESGPQSRLMLPLEELTETHEQLNEELSRRGATIEMLENASRFMTSLNQVREALGEDVNWA